MSSSLHHDVLSLKFFLDSNVLLGSRGSTLLQSLLKLFIITDLFFKIVLRVVAVEFHVIEDISKRIRGLGWLLLTA